MEETIQRQMTMTPRLNPYKAAPEAMKAMVALENYVCSRAVSTIR